MRLFTIKKNVNEYPLTGDLMKYKNHKYKLVMFDMDGTLLVGRSIFIFAESMDFKKNLID